MRSAKRNSKLRERAAAFCSTLGSIVTVAYGINDLDQIVGTAVGDRYAPGFLYASGTFTPIQFLGDDDYTEALDHDDSLCTRQHSHRSSPHQ